VVRRFKNKAFVFFLFSLEILILFFPLFSQLLSGMSGNREKILFSRRLSDVVGWSSGGLSLKSRFLRNSDIDGGVTSQNWLIFLYVVEDSEFSIP
jgi:hypothetical protein